MSQLIDFYRGHGHDAEGRTLAELWAWDDEQLEIAHDYIQWMFPLPEPSQYNPDAPVLTPQEIAEFCGDERCRENLRRSFERFIAFLGFALTADGEVVEGGNFASRIADVWESPNHNWLRITRVLRSLTLLGLRNEAGALFQRLDALYGSRRFPITAETFAYWAEAIRFERVER